MSAGIMKQSLLERLTQAVYLDRVLKIAGVAGFTVSYLNAWHGLRFGLKLGFAFSVITWFVGARFSRIYR
jgi:hypothetical protein